MASTSSLKLHDPAIAEATTSKNRKHSYNEISTTPVTSNVTREVVNVRTYVSLMMSIIQVSFGFKMDEGIPEDGKYYLHRLYELTIMKAKGFKETIPRSKDGREVECKDGYTLCCLIRGYKDDNDCRPYVKHIPGADGAETKLPVVTFKLFQACLSTMIAILGIHKNVKPAPLCANIFRAGKVTAAFPTQENWAIHGHSGLKFVANYVREMEKSERKKPPPNMPPTHQLMMVAFRLDESNPKHEQLDETKKYPTVRSICQSAMVTSSEAGFIKLTNARLWEKSFTGVSQMVALAFAKGVSAIDDPKNKKATEKPTPEDATMSTAFVPKEGSY